MPVVCAQHHGGGEEVSLGHGLELVLDHQVILLDEIEFDGLIWHVDGPFRA